MWAWGKTDPESSACEFEEKSESVHEDFPHYIILIKTTIVTGLTAGALVLGLGTLLSIVPEEESTAVTGKYADGIYTGTTFGYTDNISVTVIIEDGQVADIYFENYNDDEEYKSYADHMLQKIMEFPYGEVDTISCAIKI